MTTNTSKTTAVELTKMHVRADGPVTRDDIAGWLKDQLQGCDTWEQADMEADKAIERGTREGWLVQYDDVPGEYVMEEETMVPLFRVVPTVDGGTRVVRVK